MADKFILRRLWPFFAVLGLLQPIQAANANFAQLAQRAQREGTDALLPPHLSVVLGLTGAEQGVAVKQLLIRAAQRIRAFNVCAAAPSTVIIFEFDEATRIITAFRVSRAGTLDKAVTYESGQPVKELVGALARRALAEELRYWSADPRPPPSR